MDVVDRNPNLNLNTPLHVTVTGHGSLNKADDWGVVPPDMEIRFYVHEGDILPTATAQWMWDELVRTKSDNYPSSRDYREMADKRGMLHHVFFSEAKFPPQWVTEAKMDTDGWASGIYIHHAAKPPHYVKWREVNDFKCFDSASRSAPLIGICSEIKAMAAQAGFNGSIVIHCLQCRELI